jgi:type IV secretory pathway TraG/TraD family ATPase VirD4
MRLLLVLALLLSAAAARADTLADLQKPASTITGCVNHWGPIGTGAGVVEPTCEGKAARAAWNAQAAVINQARDVLVRASDLPLDRTKPQAVVDALNRCAAAADALQRLYHPGPDGRQDFVSVLAWMRPWFAHQTLPRPASIGDGFRILAGELAKPDLSGPDRTALYGQAAALSTRESELAAELGGDVQRQTDAAVYAVHRTALQVADAVEHGRPRPDIGGLLATAAGPGHQAIALAETRWLTRSLAAHPAQGRYLARTGRLLGAIPNTALTIGVFALLGMALLFPRMRAQHGTQGALEISALVLFALPISWLLIALLGAITGWPGRGWFGFVLWLGLFFVLTATGPRLLPGPLRRGWFALLGPPSRQTHGSARFGRVRDAKAAGHLAPAAPADAFVLGTLRDAPRGADPRFRQDGHVLTCAPTGAGKGIGAVIPNLLAYPGSAFVLDVKGENYAVTARARREAGQFVALIDPFGITGMPGHAMNWLDCLDPDDPDVVGRAGALADMLVVVTGESEPHWNDTARDLLRGLLIYVAGLPPERRTMAELRRIVTAPEDELADILTDMMADPDRGQRLPARAATAHLNRPDRERGSVLSTVGRHTAWLDDPRLCAALERSDFELRDLKRQPMTVYLAMPPDRLRTCLGFVRGFIGLALDAITLTPGRPAHRVAFFLDEFGQLGRMDRLADGITLLRGYGAQLWLFVQDLSQLKAVYPRWQSFMANTTRQFFGTADYDTARYISDALGQQTIAFETTSRSYQAGHGLKPGTRSSSRGEHLHGRPLLTPDEVMRLGPTQPIVMIAGEPPYRLDRLNYLADPAYAGRFDANPVHSAAVGEDHKMA